MIRSSGLLLSILLITPSFETLPEETTHTITVYVKNNDQAMQNVSLGIFPSSIMTQRTLIEPVIIQTDEDGKATAEINEKEVFVQLGNDGGYYPDETMYPYQENMVIEVRPINVSLSCEEEMIPFRVFDEQGVEMSAAQLQADHTYTIAGTSEEEYAGYVPQTITIPSLYDPLNDPLKVESTQCEHGILNLSLETEDHVTDSFSVSFYSDETCLEKAKDAYGNPVDVLINESEKTTVHLFEGTYYLKYNNVANRYYEPLPLKVEVNAHETKEESLSLSLCRLHVSALTDKGKEVKCTYSLNGTEEGNDFTVERGKEYILHTMVKEPGFFMPEDQTIVIKDTLREVQQETVSLHSFAIRAEGYDALSHKKIECDYEILGEDGKKKETVSAGDTVVIREVLKTDHYLPAEEKTLHIDETSDKNRTYTVKFENEPYTTLSLNVKKNVEVGVFTDEECKTLAHDLKGNEIRFVKDEEGNEQFDVMNGTYFIKVLKMDEVYKPNEEIVKVVADRSESSINEVDIRSWKTELYVRSLAGDQLLGGVRYDVFEDDQCVKTFTSTGEDVIRGLKRDHTYRIVVKDVEGNYVCEKEKTFVMKGKEEITFDFVSSVMVSLRSEEKCRVSLYHDIDCKDPAKDVNGHDAVFTQGAELAMVPGIYYAKTEAEGNFYIPEVEQFDCREDTVFDVKLERIETMIEIVDENDQPLKDVNACIRDSSGRIIETWKSDGVRKCLSSPLLKQGETYVLCESDAKEGVEFTIPTGMNNESQNTRLVVDGKKNSENQVFSVKTILLGLCAFLLMLFSGVMLLKNVSVRNDENVQMSDIYCKKPPENGKISSSE